MTILKRKLSYRTSTEVRLCTFTVSRPTSHVMTQKVHSWSGNGTTSKEKDSSKRIVGTGKKT